MTALLQVITNPDSEGWQIALALEAAKKFWRSRWMFTQEAIFQIEEVRTGDLLVFKGGLAHKAEIHEGRRFIGVAV